MSSKKKNPAAPAENQAQEQAAEPSPSPAPRKTRQAVVIQPELAVEIENCKKRISSLKALNKLTPVIDGMDKDALLALCKVVKSAAEKLGIIVTHQTEN